MLALLLLLEGVATALDLVLGPFSYVHPEERFNALAALSGDLSPYRAWCGGCTAEALAARPLFGLLGPTVLVWKLVPASLHMATVCAGAAFVWARSRWAAVCWVLLLLAAPPAFRELGLTGWGNHADSLFFPLASAALLVRGRPWLAGATMGLGVWFCTTTLLWVPGLLLLDRRWLLTAPLGMLPMALNGWAPPGGELSVADPGAWLSWLAGSFASSAWWTDAPSVLCAAAFAVLAALALHSRERLVLATLAVFLVVTLLFDGLWQENREDWALRAFELRYRVPLLTALLLGASLAPRGRVLLVPLVLVGVGLRVMSWEQPTSRVGLRVDAELPELSECSRRGLGWVEGITGWGARPPDPLPPEPDCPGWEEGAAWGWALYVGCEDYPLPSQELLLVACDSLRR